MTIAGQSRELGVGETYSIAGGVPHSARAGGDGASVGYVFAPVREDWKTAPTVEPFAGRAPLNRTPYSPPSTESVVPVAKLAALPARIITPAAGCSRRSLL